MRHRRIGRKLGVTTKHRKAMFRNMVTDLFRFDKIQTTDTKAKELRRIAEKLITLAKDGSLHKRRQAAAYVRDKEVLKKLFDVIAGKFKDRPGGYTRIIKLGFRKGDNTPVSVIELVEEEFKPDKKKKKAKVPKKQAQPGEARAKAKSSKKESAEELGLVKEAEPTPEPEAVAASEPGTAPEAAPEETAAPQAESAVSEAPAEAAADTEAPGETSEAPEEKKKEE